MLIAKKNFNYRGRRLMAGDRFDAPSRDARVLTAIGRALEEVVVAKPAKPEKSARSKAVAHNEPKNDVPDTSPETAEKPSAPEPIPSDLEIDDLRMVAEQFGIEVDGRWGKDRIQQEIDSARMTYSTRMLKAGD